jgi:hypothetical protein
MEKRSTNIHDINTWIKKVIGSCESVRQLHVANKLKNNFTRSLYVDESVDEKLYRLIDRDLTDTYDAKFYELLDGKSK